MIDLTRRSLFGVLCSLPMWLMAACHRAATITEPDWTLHPVDQQFGSTSVTMWTILYADVVVSATLSLSKEADNALDSGQSFVRLPLLVSHVYKGALKSEALELQFLPRESVRAAVKPSKLVREAAGQKSIFFLIAFEEFMPSTVYNLNRVSPSIVSWTPTSERQIVEEMASLKRFAESVRQYLDLHVPPLEALVASLID